MRNVTITLPDDAYTWAKVAAAKADTSLSAWIEDLVRERMVRDDAYQKAMAEHFASKDVKWEVAHLKREEIYTRGRPRR